MEGVARRREPTFHVIMVTDLQGLEVIVLRETLALTETLFGHQVEEVPRLRDPGTFTESDFLNLVTK